MRLRSASWLGWALYAGALACGGAGGTSGGGAPPPRLRVCGAQVLDPAGQPIVLRGYNWGNWDTAQPGDAAENAAQGASSVRIPLRWWGSYRDGVDSRDPAAPGHVDPAHLALLDQTLAWATGQGLWVVLFVDSNHGQGANGAADNFWTDPAMRREFIEVWQFLVARYRDLPFIGAWEILPEPMPAGVSDAEVKAFYDEVIPYLRALDPRTPIVVGPGDAYNLRRLEAAYTTADDQLIYTGDYFVFDDPLNRVGFITAFQQAHAAPVWVNQVGLQSGDADAEAKARQVLEALDGLGVGWAWWTYRAPTTNPDLHGIYYLAADGVTWIRKDAWWALVGGYL